MHFFFLKQVRHKHMRRHHFNFAFLLSLIVVDLILPSITSATETHTQGFSNMNISLRLNMAGRTVGNFYALEATNRTPDDTDDDDWDLEPVTYTYKRPGTAFMLGFFPGFFIHGLGHYYIGEYGKGTILLLTEGLSLFILADVAVSEMAENTEPMSKSEQGLWISASYILFFGSWIYDFAHAPSKAKKMNEKYGLTVYPEINNDKFVVKLAIDW